MSNSEVEDDGRRIYLVNHKASKSKAQILCRLDENHNPRLLSAQLLTGKVISLCGVREALKKIKKDYPTSSNEPNKTA